MEVLDKIIKGGEFLIKSTDPNTVFTPEDYDDEIIMLRSSIRDFLNKEIEPIKKKFDSVEGTEIAPGLLEKMGKLGFHGITVPEEFGGLNLNLKTDLAFGEIASDSFSFAQAIGVHAGLAVYPILLYGTKQQKEKYLTRLVTAEIKCSYCLTEPGAGSDASAGKTIAATTPDGKHYILNGQKMWISNSGFADIFSVFCKIDGDEKLSCLIVEKEWGVKLGAEEKKLGIHGASTRQVFFENIKVPVENLLGQRGKGFEIAMNALNLGRIKIAVAGSGIAKRAFRLGVDYANNRIQFKTPIINFGAIQNKIANMAIKIYTLESTWNRIGNQIDEANERLQSEGVDALQAKIKSVAEFAMECSIAKVYGSDAEQFVVDESLQIHGGMGYSGESDIAILYKNIRGNRIYEGTNEINRILIPSMLLKKAMKGEIDLMTPAMQAFQDLQSGILKPAEEGGLFKLESNFLTNIKKVCLLVAGQAIQTYQQNIKDEQEVLMNISEMLTQLFVFESTLLRSIKQTKPDSISVREEMVKVLMYDTADVLKVNAREIIFATSEKEVAITTLKAIISLLQLPAYNLKNARRKIAEYFKNQNEYKL